MCALQSGMVALGSACPVGRFRTQARSSNLLIVLAADLCCAVQLLRVRQVENSFSCLVSWEVSEWSFVRRRQSDREVLGIPLFLSIRHGRC
jgi:hypothetical protein